MKKVLALLAFVAFLAASTRAIAIFAVISLVGCGVTDARVHETALKIQRGVELELAATAPVSSAHETQRTALRRNVAALVSATE